MLRVNKKPAYQTYEDGYGTSWEVVDRRLTVIKQEVIHFHEATVGERRFWDAYVEGTEIDRAVLVPYASNVDRGDVFIIQETKYLVAQKDRKDTMPVSWLLSLQKAPIDYRMRGQQG